MDEEQQAQYLLARSKIWTPELDKLLRRWKKQIGKKEQGHLELSRTYGKRHYIFGLPAALLSGFVAAGSFSTFENCGCDQTDCSTSEYVRLAFGMLALIATTLTILQTFMNFQDRSSEHKKAADNYAELFRDIESMLMIPSPVRGDPITSLQGLRTRYDDIARRSPTLPKKYDIDLSYEVVHSTVNYHVPKAPDAHSVVIRSPRTPNKSSIHHIESMLESEILGAKGGTSRTSETSSGTTTTVQAIEGELKEKNDYSTDEESREVCIAFDLDSTPSYDPTAAAIAMSRLASQREKSLHHAFEFEMGRMDSSPHSSPRRKRKKRSPTRKKVSSAQTEEE